MYHRKGSIFDRLPGLLGGVSLLLALAGCGSDKKLTAPGSPNDPLFLATRSFVDSTLVPQAMASIGEGVSNQNGFSPDSNGFDFSPRVVPGGSSQPPSLWALMRPTAPNDYITGYQNGWHFFIYDTTGTIDSTGAVGTIHFADSVQFKNPSGAQQFPDSSTNSFQVILLLQGAASRGADSLSGQLYSNHVFQLSGGNLVLNGVERDSVKIDSATNHLRATFTMTAANVTFADTVPGSGVDFSPCPVSGSVRAVGSLAASGPGGSILVGWDITIAFLGSGRVHVTVIDTIRNLRWEYDLNNVCPPPA